MRRFGTSILFSTSIVLALTVVLLHTAQAQTLTVLHEFMGHDDGARPGAGMTMDRAGNLYGSTMYGGDWSCTGLEAGGGGSPPGCGVLFKMKKTGSGWVLDPLYVFPGDLQDYLPNYPGGLAIGPNGSLYGINFLGGNGADGPGDLYNVVPPPSAPVSVISPWSYNVLWYFTGYADGANATRSAPLIFDQAGNIYGTTGWGGPGTDNYGVVYEATRSGSSWTVNGLYSFLGGTDGQGPAGVVFDDVGNLYGVTVSGGNSDCGVFHGCGTVFELSPSQSGWTKTILHVFQQGIDGGTPGPLIRDSHGNLYGITMQYGPDNNGGTVWEMSPSNGGWTFKVIHAFPTYTVDDYGPYALTMDAAGNLYGISSWGGHNNWGFLFKLTPSNGSWIYTELYDFGTAPGQTDGCVPQGAPLLDAGGNIYGLNEFCGSAADIGNVWMFTP
jgi:hypothetical protein